MKTGLSAYDFMAREYRDSQILYDPLWCVHELGGYETVTRFRFESGETDASHGSLVAGALPLKNAFMLTGVSVRSLPPWGAAAISGAYPRARFEFTVGNRIYLDLPLDAVLWNGSPRYDGHELEQNLLIEPGVNFNGSIDWRGTAPADLLSLEIGKAGNRGMKLLLMLEGFRSRPLQ